MILLTEETAEASEAFCALTPAAAATARIRALEKYMFLQLGGCGLV